MDMRAVSSDACRTRMNAAAATWLQHVLFAASPGRPTVTSEW